MADIPLAEAASVTIESADGGTKMTVNSDGSTNNRIKDGSGNSVTSQINGAQRALDIGIDVAGVQVDPRQIRALTNSDIVKAQLQDNAGTAITVGQKTMASSLPVVIASDQSAIQVSPGNTTGKTNVLKTGSLVTTATTVDQIVLTYTVTSGKTFFMQYLTISGRQTTPAGGTSIVLGTISMETPSGTKGLSQSFVGGGGTETDKFGITFSEPIPVAASVVIRVVVTPAATSSMTWFANFGGYER